MKYVNMIIGALVLLLGISAFAVEQSRADVQSDPMVTTTVVEESEKAEDAATVDSETAIVESDDVTKKAEMK